MPTLMPGGTPGESLEEMVLAQAEELEWLLRPVHASADGDRSEEALVFPAFQSMSQSWSRPAT
ncbi:hypothetical protein ACGF5F_29825 [Streptomyces sp. NPDC047821]|uniref:hypothetical protein n=1 Tax=unclassified Streptomyces TaxID=2593676 RepID=UPI0036439499